MSDARSPMKGPMQVLKAGHERVIDLFRRYEKRGSAGFQGGRALFLEISEELALHSQIEEQVFYPAVRTVNVLTEELVKEALQNHRAADIRVEELSGMSSGDTAFEGAMGELRKSVERHSQIVETGIIPQASRLPARTLLGLGSEMELLESELRKDRAGSEPDRRRGLPGDSNERKERELPGRRSDPGDVPATPVAANPRRMEPPESYENWGSE